LATNPRNSFFEKERNTATNRHIETNEIIKTDYPEFALSGHDGKAALVIDAIRKASKEDFVLTIE
jgi:hypothetical protein